MAHHIRLFDFQTPNGKADGLQFLKNLDGTLGELFGTVQPEENLKKFSRLNKIPDYLTELAVKELKKVVKKLPEGTMQWKGTIGVYGRKVGSITKRDKDVLYRMVINIGDTEVYYLDGEKMNEPAVLPNVYALLCAPSVTENVDIKVRSDPHRKGLSNDLLQMIPRIRGRKYMRCTIVLDLLSDGLSFPEFSDETEIGTETECGDTCNHIDK